MTFEQIIKSAFPNADATTVEHILWARTPFPMGKITAQSLYKASATYRRACEKGRWLCDWCDREIERGQYTCGGHG